MLFTYIQKGKLENYRKQLFQQLLDFDFCEIGTKCMPPSLNEYSHGNIEGVFMLQVCL